MLKYVKLPLIVEEVQKYLVYKEFVAFIMISKQLYNKKLLEKYQARLLLVGLSAEKRKKYWIVKCQIKEDESAYKYYCFAPNNWDLDIDKDITRTFSQKHQFRKSFSNYKKLSRLLHAFAVKYPEIGYIQGLNYLCGNLLLLFPEQVYLFLI